MNTYRNLLAAALCGLSLAAHGASQMLYQNGTFVTAVNAGYGGADLSVVQDPAASSTNTLATTGWHNDVRKTNRLADDFTVPAGGWHLGRVTLYGYQTYAGTVSTITNVYLQIWNGCPTNPASTVVWGDLVTGRLTNAAWTHAYRVLPDELDSTRRAIMEVVADVDVTLPAGTYWLDFMLSGITTNGPYCPPAATNNPATGNALAFRNGDWQAVTNTLGQGLDFPFVLEQTLASEWSDIAPLPVAVSGAAAQLVGNKFYVLGGEESPHASQVYDLLTAVWTSDTNGLPEPVAHASAVVLGSDLYVVGGDDRDLTNAPLRVLHTATGIWETLPTDPLPRNPAGVGCAVLDGKIYAFGGEFDTTAFAYDPTAATGSRWAALAAAPALLMNVSVVAINGRLYLGGSTAGNGRQVLVYEPSTDSWSELPRLFYRQAGGRLWSQGSTLYVGGGEQGPYVVSYNTADGTNGTWFAEPMLPQGRQLFAFAQILGGKRLLAGGLDAEGSASALSSTTLGATWAGGGTYDWFINDAAGTPGTDPGWSFQAVNSAFLITATRTNPFTLRIQSLIPPTNGPGRMDHFTNTLAYAWPLAGGSGGIVGFSPDKILLDTNGLANDLGGGKLFLAVSSNQVTLHFSPAANRPPVANPNTLAALQGEPAQITPARLLANDTDPDGDPLTVTGVSAGSANGGSVTNAGVITYTPPGGFVGTDSFSYSVSDGRGGAATADVIVTVRSSGSVAKEVAYSAGGVTVKFAGVPGWRYDVQRATAPEGPWSVVYSTNAPGSGVFNYTDSDPPNPTGYYRLVRVK